MAFSKAIAGVRIGYIEGQGIIVNPTPLEVERSTLDLVMAGTDESILMIEGYGDFISKDLMLEVILINLSLPGGFTV